MVDISEVHEYSGHTTLIFTFDYMDKIKQGGDDNILLVTDHHIDYGLKRIYSLSRKHGYTPEELLGKILSEYTGKNIHILFYNKLEKKEDIVESSLDADNYNVISSEVLKQIELTNSSETWQGAERFLDS